MLKSGTRWSMSLSRLGADADGPDRRPDRRGDGCGLTSLQHVQSGKLRALGVTTPDRAFFAPDLAPLKDTVPGVEVTAWHGMMAPAGTPPAIIEKLEKEIMAFLRTPPRKAKLKEQGVVRVGNTAAEFQAFMEKELTLYQGVIKEAGISAPCETSAYEILVQKDPDTRRLALVGDEARADDARPRDPGAQALRRGSRSSTSSPRNQDCASARSPTGQASRGPPPTACWRRWSRLGCSGPTSVTRATISASACSRWPTASGTSSTCAAAEPELERLRDISGETVRLAICDGDEALTVDQREAAQTVRLGNAVGRASAHACEWRGQGAARPSRSAGAGADAEPAAAAALHAQYDRRSGSAGAASRSHQGARLLGVLRGTDRRRQLGRGGNP